MPLVSCKDIVDSAYRGGYAIAQLNTNGGDYHLSRAILEAAAECRAPVILGVYEKNAVYAGFDYIARSLAFLAGEVAPEVPVAIHLDHGSSAGVCREALEAGFTSVMYDGSKSPVEENIANSGEACESAHARGATFEAELGQLLGGESDPDNPNLVSVDDVKRLTEAVAVDMLAVAIGNSHGFYKGQPKLNMERLDAVRHSVDVPLVLHGTTGLTDDQVKSCIVLGMAKVNLGTALRTNHIGYYRRMIDELDHQGHPWRVGREVKHLLKQDCVRFLRLVGSSGRA
jgi:fructose-bisphosphate aldolase class II/tagatose 1,6-diphosphate aldolase GatY/KbaY